MTAARGLDEGAIDVAVLLDEVVARHRQVDHRMQPVGFVDAAELAVPEVVQHPGHDQLGFAHHQASVEVVDGAAGDGCRLRWTADVLPDAVAPVVDGMMAQGAAAIAQALAG